MDILDKTIPTEWAHDAVTRASQVLEPLAEPFLNSSLLHNSVLSGGLLGHRRPGTFGRIRGAVSAHPYAVGATVVVIGALAFMALRGSSSESADDVAPTGPQRVRSAA